MINMQRQALEEAAWKEQELKAQLTSLNLLYGEEVETRQTLSKQLSQLKEHYGMGQVFTCTASGSLCLGYYRLTVACICLGFNYHLACIWPVQ